MQGYPWRLAYSTEKHGTSLKTLYRNLADVDSPVLLVIKDMEDQVENSGTLSPSCGEKCRKMVPIGLKAGLSKQDMGQQISDYVILDDQKHLLWI